MPWKTPRIFDSRQPSECSTSGCQFASPYNYAGWDPTNVIDPSGAFGFGIDWGIIAIIAIFAGAAAAGIDAGLKTGDPLAGFTAASINLAIGLVSAVGLGLTVGPIFEQMNTTMRMATVLSLGSYGVYNSVDDGAYVSAGVTGTFAVLGALGIQGGDPGIARAGGDNESFAESFFDLVEYAFHPKQQVLPGTAEYARIEAALETISNRSVRGESLQRLRSGDYFTYEQWFGGADAITRGGYTYLPTTSLKVEPSYLGYHLGHEHFHVLEGIYSTDWFPNEMVANRFTDLAQDRSLRDASSQSLFSMAFGNPR